jgi:hypothetical protein
MATETASNEETNANEISGDLAQKIIKQIEVCIYTCMIWHQTSRLRNITKLFALSFISAKSIWARIDSCKRSWKRTLDVSYLIHSGFFFIFWPFGFLGMVWTWALALEPRNLKFNMLNHLQGYTSTHWRNSIAWKAYRQTWILFSVHWKSPNQACWRFSLVLRRCTICI